MMTFDVNKNNDIHLGNSGNLAIANGERSLKNRCEHYVKAIRGEMLHKLDRGIPYWKTTFGRQADIPLFESAFRDRMRELNDVISVLSFSASLADNTLKYTAVIQTIYGEITLNG
ncbi:hypothetical protein AB7W88_03770 [Providencia vermicola]|uniref:Uncharacterized protein n=1 Tax=Providencia vermicola TaxID=333965 RepID=A0AAX3S6D4_9GAMM|nr:MULTISPECIES: hypothetical protein [Providencia]ELR5121626.1 hypothetical protein [Providencia stuartii]ELR5141124.1 hypothetical protein [Providencia stuartii]ELX8378362.1 hypothetical protein [Providencia stuartii]ELZ5938401.1 hypothetical protein [Providencia stuartii]EMD5257569.1 hypothetical protein [Providencia stuartii]